LGVESSVITPNISDITGEFSRIDGGATRNNNVFHSFSEFNIGQGQRVYFANPVNIENIISRITGNSGSNIFGTLGVLGDANVFFINPNGIIFGPEAQLDIRGSFTASTANSFVFDSGEVFSVTTPNVPSLLTINAPVGLTTWLPSQGQISSTADLSVPQDLLFVAETIDLQGTLQAGNQLSLIASDALTATDSPPQPLIISADGDLTLQGGQSLEISALAHPDSAIASGGNMILRSDSPVLGDAYFTSGGDFAVFQLDGSLGSIISPQDPVFEVAGDFELAEFAGGSLQILAGGSVTIPVGVFIETAGGPFNDSVVTLSDGTQITLNGTTEPTLDIRAGTTGFFGTPEPGSPTSADISIGSIFIPGGQVFLSNQYQPDPSLTGDIEVGFIETLAFEGGGNITIDSRGGISFELIDVSGQSPIDFSTGGNAGDIKLLADGDIFMPFGSAIFSFGLQGGAIAFASDTAIIQEDAPFFGFPPEELSFIESVSLDVGDGGDIRFTAPLISIGGNVVTTAEGEGKGGDIVFQTEQLIANQASILTRTFGSGDAGDVQVTAADIDLDFSLLGTLTLSFDGGDAGTVTVNANTVSATTGAQISSFTAGVGDAGNVTVNASDSITLVGFQPGELTGDVFAPATIASSVEPFSEGNSGIVTINTGTLTVLEGANVGTSTFGIGNAGTVIINATELIELDGAVFVDFETFQDSQPSGISSEVFTGAIGQGGEIILSTPILRVINGGTITSLSSGDGDAGNVTINATDSVLFDGVASFADVGQPDRISSATVETLSASTGSGGTLTINAPNLTVSNGARLEGTTEGVGQSGNIILNITDNLRLEGDGTGIFANTTAGSTGDGGDIVIDPQLVEVLNGAQISVASEGTGTAGNILVIGNTLQLDDGQISAETVSTDGGNITLLFDEIITLENGSRISSTAGTAQAGGDGGNIAIDTTYLIATPDENNDITANAFFGSGGRVVITAEGILGLTPRSRAELEGLLGTTDPALLDPTNLPSSDITAISQANPELQGEVVITSPDTDPNQGAIALPDNIVDASRLIAQGCSSGSIAAQEIGSLVVTGRGGLPTDPTGTLNSNQLLLDWVTTEAESVPLPAAATISAPEAAAAPQPIEEVQALTLNDEGEVVLVAQGNDPVDGTGWLSVLTCTGTVQGN
jgi:filamentous hemagglutinin family protein